MVGQPCSGPAWYPPRILIAERAESALPKSHSEGAALVSPYSQPHVAHMPAVTSAMKALAGTCRMADKERQPGHS